MPPRSSEVGRNKEALRRSLGTPGLITNAGTAQSVIPAYDSLGLSRCRVKSRLVFFSKLRFNAVCKSMPD